MRNRFGNALIAIWLKATLHRHCEEQSDEAILRDCRAPLSRSQRQNVVSELTANSQLREK
jgi:hypothetical protein